jgi:hypothetical protein
VRAFRLAYDGSGYRGFQRQPHGETVEDELFAALRELGVAFEGGSPVGYAAAGRTDAGQGDPGVGLGRRGAGVSRDPRRRRAGL